jgi:hypothetical protein
MTLHIAALAWPLQIVAYGIIGTMLIGFVMAFVGLARVIFRSGVLVDPPEDAKLPYFERVYRGHQRAGQFLTAEKFRGERQTVLIGFACFIGGMAAMWGLTLLFGR